jgi:hypothetical protein
MRIFIKLLLWSIGISVAAAGLSVVALHEYRYGRVFLDEVPCGAKDSDSLQAGCGVDLSTVGQWEEVPHN